MITCDLLKITDQWKDAELTVLLFPFIYYIFVFHYRKRALFTLERLPTSSVRRRQAKSYSTPC